MYYTLFDKDTGSRITSLLEGVHFDEDKKDEELEKYKAEYPNSILVVLKEDEYNQVLAKNLHYIDGQLQPMVHTAPEKEDEPIMGMGKISMDELIEQMAEMQATIEDLTNKLNERA